MSARSGPELRDIDRRFLRTVPVAIPSVGASTTAVLLLMACFGFGPPVFCTRKLREGMMISFNRSIAFGRISTGDVATNVRSLGFRGSRDASLDVALVS